MEVLPPLPTEQLLFDQLPKLQGSTAIVISPGRAQFAEHLLNEWGYTRVGAWYLDLYAATAARTQCDPRVEITCSADMPDEQVDLVAMPVLQRGESELTRELLQSAHQRLVAGGYLVVSVDNPRDQWVHEQLQKLFEKVSCDRSKQGCVYWAKKTAPLKKLKNLDCQFTFRDEEHLIQLVSRPGVFCHRRVDPGARQLLLTVDIDINDTVLDMGCGVGTMALSAAKRTTGCVFGVDSNARAIECLRRGAAINGLDNIHAHLNSDGELDLPMPIDVALANPPYFGDKAIAQHFVDTCIRMLRPGGALLVVTKSPGWYEDYYVEHLDDVSIFPSGQYHLACGRKP